MANVTVVSEFPVIDEPSQVADVVLNGRRVRLHLKYSARGDYWTFDLYEDNVALLHGKKLVLGIDLLQRYNFGLGQMLVWGFTRNLIDPNRNNLPNRDVRIFFVRETSDSIS